jgi:signal transduction histidine kinase
MTASSFSVPVHVIDSAVGADDRWPAVLANTCPEPVHIAAELPPTLASTQGCVVVMVLHPTIQPEQLDRYLALAMSAESKDRYVVLMDAPDEMPPVSSAVWLPLDARDSEVSRWVDWLSRSVLDARALRLVLQCPVDNINPVVGFDRDGALIYANASAQGLLPTSVDAHSTVVDKLRADALATLGELDRQSQTEFWLDNKRFAFRFVGDRSLSMIHGYGFDVTDLSEPVAYPHEVPAQDDSKNEFLRSMSHELRTPLNAVLGSTEALREGVYGELGPEQLDAVQAIRTSSKHLLTLINDILDISRIEAGCMQLEPCPVGVQTLCDSVVQILGSTARNKDISLDLDIDPRSEVLQADPLRVRQILLNLMGNAVKFTPEGGEVGLDVRCAGQEMVFRIWDTGPGIPQEFADVIFEPFVQAGGDRRSAQLGSGLGLSLARQLAQLHGGDVRIETFGGPGTVMEVVLPIGAPSAVPLTDPLATTEWFMPQEAVEEEPDVEVVLIAEDIDSNYQHIRDLLVSLGYRVERAHNGQEAVGQCRSLQPSVVLMDIDMPVMNGLDAIRILKEDAQTENVPIIAVTAMANIVDARACMSAGANAFLPKPFALRALMNTMSTLVA